MGGVPLNRTSREKDIFGIVCVTEVDVNLDVTEDILLSMR